jgi:hypothetical protein
MRTQPTPAWKSCILIGKSAAKERQRIPFIFNSLGVVGLLLAKLLSFFMQDIAHFAAEFPSGG